jgi:opacity protein-like surface antigen
MLRWIPAVLLSCLLLPAMSLHAYDNYDDIHSYVSGGLHHWSSNNSSAYGLKLNAGQQLNTFFAAEAQFAIGGKDTDTDTSLDRLFGLYGKFILPLDLFSPYAKLGVTSASLTTGDTSTREFELSYGLGAEFNITSRFYVDMEYMVYLDVAAMQLEGFTLGVGYKLP